MSEATASLPLLPFFLCPFLSAASNSFLLLRAWTLHPVARARRHAPAVLLSELCGGLGRERADQTESDLKKKVPPVLARLKSSQWGKTWVNDKTFKSSLI